MASYLTSSTLIDEAKRLALIPATQSTFQDSDFLAFANQELRIALLPTIMQYHQEYLVVDSDPISIVANTDNYAIPYRAVGGKFREVFYKDTNGNLRAMTRISPDDRPYYQQSNFQNRFVYFYIQGNDVVLMPEVGENPTGFLVFSYFLRPNELVSEDRVAIIQSISVGASTTVFTVDAVPENMTSSSVVDLLQTRPGHKTLKFDVTPTAVDSSMSTITLDNDDVPASLIVGDYIAFAGESIIPQIPSDLHDVLAQRVAARCLQALGDQASLANANTRIGEMEQKTGTLVDNRSEGQAIKLTNLRGTLRSAKIRKRGWL